MLKGKSKITMLAATDTAAALLVGGLVVASNMGFKGRFQFQPGVTTWFSPPYTSPYANAGQLLSALAPGDATASINRLVPTAPPSFQFWLASGDGGPSGVNPKNFVLKPGEGYQISVGTASDVVVVGAHDPFVTVPAGQDGTQVGNIAPGFIAGRDYLVSVPWHTTYINANDFLLDLAAQGSITRLDQVSGNPPAFFFWTGNDGNDSPKNYAIQLGRAYQVRVLTSSSGFVPAHF